MKLRQHLLPFQVDLTGGCYDAGDNVKFGLPLAFTTTRLGASSNLATRCWVKSTMPELWFGGAPIIS